MENETKGTTEEFKVTGEGLLQKCKELLREGNIRRLIIKDEKGEVLMEIPVTFAVVGTVLAPALVAIGAIAALVTTCSIAVERKQ